MKIAGILWIDITPTVEGVSFFGFEMATVSSADRIRMIEYLRCTHFYFCHSKSHYTLAREHKVTLDM